MALLTLHRKQLFKLSIPYWVFINEQPVGIMQSKKVNIQIPPGQYDLSIRIILALWKWRFQIRGEKKVILHEGQHHDLMITDRERWWNILFDIDLIFWIAKLFFELPYPWNTIYEVVSNGFFVLWAKRIWYIRNNYFKLIEK